MMHCMMQYVDPALCNFSDKGIVGLSLSGSEHAEGQVYLDLFDP